MDISCTSCHKTIKIPDQKVPKDQAFSLTCPSCKNKFRVDQHLQPPEPESPPQTADDTAQTGPEEEGESEVDTYLLVTQEEFDDDDVLEIYDEGDRIALILDYENEEFWIETLAQMDYKLQTAKSPEHGVHKLKFTEFDLFILHESFSQTDLKESPVYKYLLEMPMSQRRKVFVVLVGKNFKSTSSMEAYALSVNVVINEKDFDKVQGILKRTMTEHDNFYKVFKDSLKAYGKV
ncbi:MAG: zinc-ribbon domain-containing protein [Nitrospinaceae bacterium]